ncbi:MAG: glutamate 5-kinase [Pseudomonadota bacterium]
MTPYQLAGFKRIVVKIGSSLLVDSAASAVKRTWLDSVADDLAALKAGGADILVVSSGAIALGRGLLGLSNGVLRLEESQAAAATGQIALAQAYMGALQTRGMAVGQVLLTLDDTEERRRYLNARNTISTLLRLGSVPIVNENDTVATSEIRYGDNDRLAARVAGMVSADCLVLLSDVEGLYTAPPADDPQAALIPFVPRIDAAIEAMAGDAGTELSRGGMVTKIAAARIATDAGAAMVIASGREPHPLSAIDRARRCTWFAPATTPGRARKRWISGTLEPRGTVTLDPGAAQALARGKSLLPAGITGIDGNFFRGDAVVLRCTDGTELGRGLSAYDAEDARKIIGRHSDEIAGILGYTGRSALIHRDDMALKGEPGL